MQLPSACCSQSIPCCWRVTGWGQAGRERVSPHLLSDDSLGMDRAYGKSAAVETRGKAKQTSRVEASLGMGPVATALDSPALPGGTCKESKSSRF